MTEHRRYRLVGGENDGRLIELPENVEYWRMTKRIDPFQSSLRPVAASCELYTRRGIHTPDGTLYFMAIETMTTLEALQRLHMGDW